MALECYYQNRDAKNTNENETSTETEPSATDQEDVTSVDVTSEQTNGAADSTETPTITKLEVDATDTDIPATEISLKAGTVKASYLRGETFMITATFTPENATSNTLITWKSSNITVAKVDDNGYVECVRTGKATITATLPDGTSDEITIRVGESSIGTNGSTLTEETPPANGELLFSSGKYSNWSNKIEITNYWPTDVCLVFKDAYTNDYVKTVYVQALSSTTISMPYGTFTGNCSC